MTHYRANPPASPHRNLPLLQLPSLTVRKKQFPLSLLLHNSSQTLFVLQSKHARVTTTSHQFSCFHKKTEKAPIISPQWIRKPCSALALFESNHHSEIRSLLLCPKPSRTPISVYGDQQKVVLSSSKIDWSPHSLNQKEEHIIRFRHGLEYSWFT